MRNRQGIVRNPPGIGQKGHKWQLNSSQTAETFRKMNLLIISVEKPLSFTLLPHVLLVLQENVLVFISLLSSFLN